MDIRILRKSFGLKELTYRPVTCRRLIEQKNFTYRNCENQFESQYVGEKRVEFFCRNCRYVMGLAQNDYAFDQ